MKTVLRFRPTSEAPKMDSYDPPGAPMVAAAFTRPVYRALSSPSRPPRTVARHLTTLAAAHSVGSKALGSKAIGSPRRTGPSHTQTLSPVPLTLGAAFDAGLETLTDRYRCEYVYKAKLVSKIVFGRHSPNTASALIELQVGRAVADVVICNGTTSVYEIKTDLDNFDRLAGQLREYGTRAEYVNVVVSEHRIAQALRAAPDWVGVIGLRGTGALSSARAPISRRDHLNPADQFQLLRTDEARRVVAQVTGNNIDAPAGRAWALLRSAFTTLDPVEVNDAVTTQLRARGAAAATGLVSDPTFPTSLRALAYAQPLSQVAQQRLRAALGSPIGHWHSLGV